MEDNSIILNRFKKNLKVRKPLIKNGLHTAYRLYEKDIPEYPYIVDIYNSNAVIYEKGKRLDNEDLIQKEKHRKHLNIIISAVKELFNLNDSQIVFKERRRQKGKEQYTQLAKVENFISIKENHFKFRVNLRDYLDTGLFLDHRPLRQIIYSEAKDKKVLNLFSYTGSISVAAALAGGYVTTVDMSKTYIAWAEENFVLNNLNPKKHRFVQDDVLKYIEQRNNDKYDIIILDPPSFSNSKRMDSTFTVQESHVAMINKLMKLLNKDGVLYFSNNYRDFKMDSSILETYNVQDITKKSIPIDFRDMKIHHCFKLKSL